MSTAVPFKSPQPPKPPTLAQIMAMLPGLKLYNPSSEWVPLDVHGRTDLWLAPDLGGSVLPHPVTGEPTECAGITEIKGRYLTQKDSSGKTIEGQDAHAVVSFAIKTGNLGQMGVVWLPGRDSEEDQRYIDFSRDTFLKYEQEQDERVLDKRREFKANWLKNDANKGKPVPPPTPNENAAMERSLKRESRRIGYAFECDVSECPGYATNEWEKFREHMVAAHAFEPNRQKYEGDVKATSGEEAPSDDELPIDTETMEAAATDLAKKTGQPRRRAKRG